jgi:hypothetical protein
MLKQILAGVVLMLCAATAQPHGAGSHDDGSPMARGEAIERADRVVTLLVKRGKLRPSWQTVRARDATTQQTREGLTLWVVEYDNPAEAKASRTLYVSVDQFGNYEGSSHKAPAPAR